MNAFIALAGLLVLAGCASTQWRRTDEVDSVSINHIETEDVGKVCLPITGIRADACCTRTVQNRHSTCTIWTQPNPPAFIYEHEVKHCWGWDH